MLLDIANRKFYIFGVIFWAQDTFILALLMLTFVLFIVLFTVTFGRIWCGWACPQTVFMEMIYRKIEYLIEEDHKKRYNLDQSSRTANKIVKKVTKHTLFIIVSILITTIFLMWFVGPDGLLRLASEPVNNHLQGYIILLIVSAIFYWIYSYFREQICTMVCPYGRMQGVLLDSKSVVVAYDYKRGEPRGYKNSGDCIDCYQCVSVCPTGIDIRNGTQLECINCTACIDECNRVMRRINKPTNLIRFDSIEGIEKGQKSIWNARNKAYSAVLICLIGFFLIAMFTRPIVETTILRTPGSLFKVYDNSEVSNIYNIKIINKTNEEIPLVLKLLSHKGRIKMSKELISLKEHGLFESVLVLTIKKDQLSKTKNNVVLGIFSNGEQMETYKVTFLAPEE